MNAVSDASLLFPFACVAAGAMLVLLLESAASRVRNSVDGADMMGARLSTALVAIATGALLLALVGANDLLDRETALFFTAKRPALFIEPTADFGIMLLVIAALLTVWLSLAYLPAIHIDYGEYYALLLLSLVGAFIAVCSFNLISLFLGLEIMSLPLYALVGFDRRRLASSEAALKAFLTGSFSSAVTLYGMALLYGATGTLDFGELGAALDPESRLAMAGIALLLSGLAFKMAAVPFHQWAPDVYEGAPTTVSGFMSITLTTTTTFVLIRLMTLVFAPAAEKIQPVLGAIAVLGMLLGSLMALVQTNLKRMLAYSGIAHAGCLLCGFAVGGAQAHAALIFYTTSLLFMHVGAFGAMAAMARGGREWEQLSDFTGLARGRPVLAAVMALFMLALAGIPGTAGFMARLGIVSATLSAGHMGLSLAIVLSAVVLFASYLRIPTLMYMREGHQKGHLGTPLGATVAVGLCAVAVLYLGLFPSHDPLGLDVLALARRAAEFSW